MIPAIDVSDLFASSPAVPARADEALWRAAREVGFATITGLPADLPIGTAARSSLLRIFDLDTQSQHGLWRQKFAPGNINVYRGWFPVQPGNLTA